jgi:ribose transport system permease protein
MTASTFAGKTGRFLSRYGMTFVLALLCLFFSLATNTLQPATGPDAARRLARRIASSAGEKPVLVAARETDEDRQFAAALGEELKRRGISRVTTVSGDPRAARQALEQLASEGRPLGFIATTPDCASWTVFQNVNARFPALGQPGLITPESTRWPAFLTRQNLLNVANQISVVAILAIGMTVVIVTGGIDLSVGSLIALSAVLATVLIRDHADGVNAGTPALVLGSLAGIGVCALVGALSGALVAGFRVPPFIATLAVMQVASGLAFIAAKGGSIYELPDSFTWLGRGTGWFGIPHAVALTIVLYGAAHFLMTRTTLGRRIYAVGGNAEAARLSGVSVGLVLVFAYTLSGAMSGLGGVLLASQLKSGAPTYGLMYELYVIAAVVVGGTSLSGGEGRIFGTLTGALIIAVIQNGMNLTGVESYRQKVVLGLVILGAVLLDMLKKRDWRSLARRFAPSRD